MNEHKLNVALATASIANVEVCGEEVFVYGDNGLVVEARPLFTRSLDSLRLIENEMSHEQRTCYAILHNTNTADGLRSIVFASPAQKAAWALYALTTAQQGVAPDLKQRHSSQ